MNPGFRTSMVEKGLYKARFSGDGISLLIACSHRIVPCVLVPADHIGYVSSNLYTRPQIFVAHCRARTCLLHPFPNPTTERERKEPSPFTTTLPRHPSPRTSQATLQAPYLPPPPHPHLTPQRLPQKPLPRLKPLLPQFKLIPPEHRSDNKRQLHLGHVAAHARPGPVAERDKSVFLRLGHGVPALGPEGVGVGAPDGGRVVDGVGGDGEDGVCGEVVLMYGDAGAGGHEAREAEGGGGVDAEGLVDDVVEACAGGG